jgi:catalase
MQSVLGGTMQKAGEAISGAMSSNKKLTEMKNDVRVIGPDHHLTSDFGVKSNTHDNWLSASTADRQGPQLLEDNFGREKVNIYWLKCHSYLIRLPDP